MVHRELEKLRMRNKGLGKDCLGYLRGMGERSRRRKESEGRKTEKEEKWERERVVRGWGNKRQKNVGNERISLR